MVKTPEPFDPKKIQKELELIGKPHKPEVSKANDKTTEIKKDDPGTYEPGYY